MLFTENPSCGTWVPLLLTPTYFLVAKMAKGYAYMSTILLFNLEVDKLTFPSKVLIKQTKKSSHLSPRLALPLAWAKYWDTVTETWFFFRALSTNSWGFFSFHLACGRYRSIAGRAVIPSTLESSVVPGTSPGFEVTSHEPSSLPSERTIDRVVSVNRGLQLNGFFCMWVLPPE